MRNVVAIVFLLIAIADPSAIAAGLNHDCCPQGTCFCELLSTDGDGCRRDASAGCSVDASNADSIPLPGSYSGVEHQRLLPTSITLSPILQWVRTRPVDLGLIAPPVLLPPTPPPRPSRPV